MRSNLPKTAPPFCSILELRRGTRAFVRGFAGADAEATRILARRLIAMGMPIGCEAEVLVQRSRGPILLRACGSRIALGQDEARCIQVELCSAPEDCVAPERCGRQDLDAPTDVEDSTPIARGESDGR